MWLIRSNRAGGSASKHTELLNFEKNDMALRSGLYIKRKRHGSNSLSSLFYAQERDGGPLDNAQSPSIVDVALAGVEKSDQGCGRGRGAFRVDWKRIDCYVALEDSRMMRSWFVVVKLRAESHR